MQISFKFYQIGQAEIYLGIG